MSNPTTPPTGLVERLQELRGFLNGTAAIDRLWFGERRDNSFLWWRYRLADIEEAITRLQAAQSPQAEATERVVYEAAFLLARIEELDWCGEWESFVREWSGHVDPPLSRLSKALAALSASPAPGVDVLRGIEDALRTAFRRAGGLPRLIRSEYGTDRVIKLIMLEVSAALTNTTRPDR